MEKESDYKSSREKPNQQRSRFPLVLYSAIKMHHDCMLSKHWDKYEGMFKKKLPLSFDKITYNH
eukprot:2354695-Ditylum_brightwellii.AAC.1